MVGVYIGQSDGRGVHRTIGWVNGRAWTVACCVLSHAARCRVVPNALEGLRVESLTPGPCVFLALCNSLRFDFLSSYLHRYFLVPPAGDFCPSYIVAAAGEAGTAGAAGEALGELKRRCHQIGVEPLLHLRMCIGLGSDHRSTVVGSVYMGDAAEGSRLRSLMGG
eukprot:7755234-Pyramimonas_sp.AAC.1